MTARYKETFMKLAAVAVGLLFAILLGELTIRLLEPRPDTNAIPLTGSERLYGFRENSRGYAGGVEFETNAAGFRTLDFPKRMDDRETVIVVLGDSYAFGYGVRERDSFPAVLQRELATQHPDKEIRVINLGVPGYNTLQELATLKEVGPSLHPSIVLLSYHLNDIERPVERTDKAVSGLAATISWMKHYCHLFRFFLPRFAALARSLHIDVKTTATTEVPEYVTDGPAWRRNQETLKELFALCRERRWRAGVVVVPYIIDLTDSHPCLAAYQVVVTFCGSQRVPAINAFEYFRGLSSMKLWINGFDGHPNREGHMLIAKAAGDLIKDGHLLD